MYAFNIWNVNTNFREPMETSNTAEWRVVKWTYHTLQREMHHLKRMNGQGQYFFVATFHCSDGRRVRKLFPLKTIDREKARQRRNKIYWQIVDKPWMDADLRGFATERRN